MTGVPITYSKIIILLIMVTYVMSCNRSNWVGEYDLLENYNLDGVYMDTIKRVNNYNWIDTSNSSTLYYLDGYSKYVVAIRNDTILLSYIQVDMGLHNRLVSYSKFKIRNDTIFTKAYKTYRSNYNTGVYNSTIECDELDTILISEKGEIKIPNHRESKLQDPPTLKPNREILHFKKDSLNISKYLKDQIIVRLSKSQIKDCS